MNFQKKTITYIAFSFLLLFALSSCQEKRLGILGPRNLKGSDTLYSEIPEFNMIDQNGNEIKLSDISKDIHIAAFFFTSCPTICPKVMRNISRIDQHFLNNPNLSYLCFSLDFKRDSVGRLKEYYDKVGFTNPKLHLLRGQQQDDTKNIAKNYMSTAVEDNAAPGGINHSGWILLVDRKKHLRSFALGTDDKDVDRFMEDIDLLLNEK